MKILSTEQIRELDKATIESEKISQIALIERAANAFVHEFGKHETSVSLVHIFCGPGNNGADGLEIGRILKERGYRIRVFNPKSDSKQTAAFAEILKNVKESEIAITHFSSADELRAGEQPDVIIDALFGSGLSRPLTGVFAETVNFLNTLKCRKYSVDIPSGLFCDLRNEKTDPVFAADRTFTFEMPKLSFFLCENHQFTGDWAVLPIGLNRDFIQSAETQNYHIDPSTARNILKPRNRCDHKGKFGHVLIAAGSFGKMGAAILAVKAALRAGAGLTTAFIPRCGYRIMQISNPEAMVLADEGEKQLSDFNLETDRFNAFAIGPGIGTGEKTKAYLTRFIEAAKGKSVVIDADALNIIAETGQYHLFEGNIITPHPKEFARLAGDSSSDWERLEKARDFASRTGTIVILKSAFTSIHFPNRKTWFNTNGNAGMAKGGSGDVLTGIIGGLLAQGYSAEEASILGVYLHGLAGDVAVENKTVYGLLASDIIESIPTAYQKIRNES